MAVDIGNFGESTGRKGVAEPVEQIHVVSGERHANRQIGFGDHKLDRLPVLRVATHSLVEEIGDAASEKCRHNECRC